MTTRSLLTLLPVCLTLWASFGRAGELLPDNAAYSYYYKNAPVSLTPSKSLIAMEESGADFTATPPPRLARDPLSERHAVKSRSIGIYRHHTPAGVQNGGSAAGPTAATLAAATGRTVQPVFQQGRTILVPFDEVIVGFKDETDISQAQAYLAPHMDALGLRAVAGHRKNTFIVTIGNPANGRVFRVARRLSALERISFSEPNFILLLPEETGGTDLPPGGAQPAAGYTGTPEPSPQTIPQTDPNWTIMANLDFEEDGLPQGWQSGNLSGTAAAYWGAGTHRQHGGARSLYCAASGPEGVIPPGPVPLNMGSFLQSPVFNLSPYQEVYVEFWFHSASVTGAPDLFALPMVLVFDAMRPEAVDGLKLVANDGDTTPDPAAGNGWRRVLYRVPPAFRTTGAFFEFRYISRGAVQTEGAYLDDIRIVATAALDAEPLSNDTYSGRQYELRNVGQIAGLVNNRSDLHLPEAWSLVTPSTDLVVAVIDSGVEPTHPDLNLVTGYDPDGSVGGQPRGTPRSGHGTACAGNVGAIRNNGLGVTGTAPGVKIMPVYSGETLGDCAAAIDVAVARGARILSNSWGWVGAPLTDVENAIRSALAAGRIVLFAAGNGPDRPSLEENPRYSYEVNFPGNLTATTDLICVGATSPTDEHKNAASSDGKFGWGSSYVGAGPDICAPGPWSYTTDLLGAEGYNDGSLIDPADPVSADYTPDFGGTSSATAKVAGIVALMLSRNPLLTPGEVKSILRNSADDIDEPGVDDKTGAGRVNALRAVQAVPSTGGAPTVTSTRPVGSATGVPLGSNISVTFSDQLDSATINSATFTLSNSVAGRITYNPDTYTATFTPSAPLQAGTGYTATVTTGVKDLAGRSLPASHSWSFTTAAAETVTPLLVNSGFENGDAGWFQSSSGGFELINSDIMQSRSGSGYAWLGGYDSAGDTLSQDIIIPAGASAATVRFWYRIESEEGSAAPPRDMMSLVAIAPGTGAVMQTVATLSNLDSTAGAWLQSPPYHLPLPDGGAVRLLFTVTTSDTLNTSFYLDDIQITAATPATHTLTVHIAPDRSGTVMDGTEPVCGPAPPCAKTYQAGTLVTLMARGTVSADFAGWSGECATLNGTACTLLMNANKSVYANFTSRRYTVSFIAATNGSISGVASQTVDHGGSTSPVTAVPAAGYRFLNWTDGSGNDAGTANPFTLAGVTADRTVIAGFGPVTATAADGDINSDGMVTVADSLLTLRMAVGLDATTGEKMNRGDMNRDGVISSVDALLILKKTVGL